MGYWGYDVVGRSERPLAELDALGAAHRHGAAAHYGARRLAGSGSTRAVTATSGA